MYCVIAREHFGTSSCFAAMFGITVAAFRSVAFVVLFFFFSSRRRHTRSVSGIPAEPLFRSPHDLSHLGFLAGQIGRLITISTTPVIAGDSFEMDAVGALRLSPLRRGLAIDSTVDIFTFYVPHRHVYGEQWIKFMKDGDDEEI